MSLAVMGLGSRGLDAYIRNLEKYKDIEYTAICDQNKAVLKYVKETYAPNAECYVSDEDFFAAGKLADWLIIATLDKDHYRHLITAIKLGYNILMEKPVTEKNEELDEILALAEKHGNTIIVCHVLRYAPYFAKIKEVIDSGAIGEVVSIVQEEGVGYWHFAHSYVRGNWRNTKVAAPVLLAKNCHDFDLLYWYMGKECKSVTSYGSLSYFTQKNKPNGATARCTDGCPMQSECPYDTEKIYLKGEIFNQWAGPIVTGMATPTLNDTRKALETDSKYGRCVYSCDNNVYDHQVVNMQFEGGAVATFSVSAFTPNIDRRIHITGTKGELLGVDSSAKITVQLFGEALQTIEVSAQEHGHLGGDAGICETLHKLMCGEEVQAGLLTSIDVTAKSHKIVYAAIKSAYNNGETVTLYNGTE